MKKFPILFSAFLFLGIVTAKSQIVTTYAGTGTAGFSGDGGAATSAKLHSPGGLEYSSGNLYISDVGNSRIRVINSSGIINTYAGNGTAGYSGDGGAATSAEINTPKGLAMDTAGNLYIADEANNRIRKVSAAGTITTVAGNGTAGYSGDGSAATSAELNSPYDVAIDASGNLYIADAANNRIRKVNTSGIISTIAGNGTAGFSGDGSAATSAELNHPINVSLDGSGNIYIVDFSNNRIRMVNTSGTISTYVGNGTAGFSGDGSAATSAEIDMSTGVAKMDASGNLYIADDGNNRIRTVNGSNIINTVAGNGTAGSSGDGGLATSAEFNSPNHIEFDNLGNYYISDGMNNRIREVHLFLTTSPSVTSNVSCYGGSNGSVSVTATEGTTPYTYSWSGGGTNSTKTGLTAGTYSVLVTDNNGINGTASLTITQPSTALSVSTSVTSNVSCHSGSNGSVSSTPSGGTSPYTYSWSGGGTSSTNTGLTAGTYTITVTDNHACTATASATTTQPATALSLSASVTSNVSCYGGSNGNLSSTPSGGVSPYTYSWSGGGTSSTNTDLTAGTYTITVTDNHSCTATANATITQPAALSVSANIVANVTCNAENNGSASATPSGGVSPYTYYWSNTETGTTISGLSAGTYWLTIMDNNGCLDTVSASASVTQPMALRDSVVSSTNTCPQNNSGTVTVGAKYGTSPYTYLWIPGGQTTATVSGLSAGYYTVVVTDHHSCSDSLPVTVSTIAATGITASPGIIICPGINDTLNASSAAGYAWSTGATTSRIVVSPSTSTTYTLISVNAGCHDTIHYNILTGCGNSCSNAFLLTTGGFYMSDSLAPNTSKWYYFIDTAVSLPIIVQSLTGSAGGIHKIVLYSSCGGSVIAQDSVSDSSDSLGISASSLTIGNTYYLLVENYVPGCDTCSKKAKYSILDNQEYITVQADGISNPIKVSGCGLNYTFSSLPLHGRYDCGSSADQAIPYPSPNVFNITIPAGATVTKAYVLYSVIDVPSNYTPQIDLNSVPFTATLIGGNKSSTCWQSQTGTCTCGGSECTNYPYNYDYASSADNSVFGYYNNGNGNHYAYCADVTSAVTGSGNYTITGSGLPIYNRTAGNSPTNCSDVNGATLIVIYQDPNANYTGTFTMGMESDYENVTIPYQYILGLNPTPPAGATGNAFDIIDDQQSTADQYAINLSNQSAVAVNYTNGNPTLWNTNVVSIPTFNNNAILYTVYTDPLGDCDDMLAKGAYYQVPNSNNPIISASPSGMVCSGSYVDLSVDNPVAGYNYTWSNGQTGTSTVILPTNCNQTYSVTATNGSCGLGSSYIANVFEPQITASSTPVCTANTKTVRVWDGDVWVNEIEYELEFTASMLCNNCGNVTYTFSTSDLSLQTTVLNGGSSLMVYVPQNSSDLHGFTVYVTATCNGFSCSTSFYEPGCCGADAGNPCAWVNPDLNNASGLDQINTHWNHFVDSTGGYYLEDMAGVPSGDCLQLNIDGVFNVDQNLTIKNCEITMGSMGKIVLSNGANLTIENSYLYPCSSMWDGIYVPSGCTLTVKDGSLLEGAVNAIVSQGGSVFTVENSTLNANYKGIVVDPVSWSDAGPVIEGSQISCNAYASNTPPFNGGTNVTLGAAETLDPYGPYANWESEIGIQLNNVHYINIGNPASSGDMNTFDNLYYGIYSEASSTDIYNNTFNNMTACAGCSNLAINSDHPSCVVAYGNPTGTYTVNIGGTSTRQLNYFNYSTIGVTEHDTLNFNVIKNQFDADNAGVCFQRNYKTRALIADNVMANMGGNQHVLSAGVMGYNNPNCITTVETNTVSIVSPNFYSYGVILEESVLNAATKYTVYNNTISGIEFGVYAIGFKGGLIEGNNIYTNPYLSVGSNEGIALYWGVGTTITDNTVTGQKNGDAIRLDDTHGLGSTYSLTVTCNNTNSTYYGLYFSGPQVNDYIDRNNLNSYGTATYGAGLYLNATGTFYTQGTLANGTDNEWYDNPGGAGYPFATYSTVNGNIFYVNDATAGTSGNPANNGGSSPVRPLYTSGADCFSCTEPCIMQTCNTCWILFGHSIIHSDNLFPVYSSASHWLEKYELYSSVLANDTAYIDSTTMRLDTVVHSFIDSVASSNMGHIYSVLNLLGDTNGVNLVDIDSANSLLSSLSSPDTVELTFKQVFQIYTDMLAGGQSAPSSTQLSTLQGIAELCPEQYGPAVYSARAILAPVDTTLYVNTCELLPDSVSRDFRRPGKHVADSIFVQNVVFNLYPNPNNGNFTIEYNVGIVTGCKVELYNTLGEAVGEYTLAGSSGTMNISNTMLSNGIYIWKIYSGKQVLKYGKVIIMK